MESVKIILRKMVTGNTKFSEFNKYRIEIESLTSFLDLKYSIISFAQRVWHIRNNLFDLKLCVCGNPAKYSTSKSKHYVSCSKTCQVEYNKQIMLGKYGVDSAMKVEDFKNKMIVTNNEKYGTNSFLNSKDFKNKMGYDNPMKNNEIKDNRTKTIIEKYGVEHISQCIEIKDKISATNKSIGKTLAENNKKFCELKYGESITNAMKSVEIQNKLKENFISNNKYNYGKDYELIEKPNGTYRLKHLICGNEFEIISTTKKKRTDHNVEVCLNCNPLNNGWSTKETEIMNIITRYIPDSSIIKNNRAVLNGKEIDIYIPSLKLAIEFNGCWWHSTKYKPKDYHQEKWENCDKLGIRLIQIWEHHWVEKRDLIENYLIDIFQNKIKIFARKCEIRKVDSKSEREFLNENHLQGYDASTVCYGLYFDSILLQVMSFKKSKKGFEINRLCTKSGHSIIGGTKRLFKSFIKEYNPIFVSTYSSNDYFTGHIYEELGFELKKITQPGYFYFRKIGDILSREKCQKHKLVKMGYNSEKSERQIMSELGYVRVYNSGNKYFEWIA